MKAVASEAKPKIPKAIMAKGIASSSTGFVTHG
jgi:hypothetical protein